MLQGVPPKRQSTYSLQIVFVRWLAQVNMPCMVHLYRVGLMHNIRISCHSQDLIRRPRRFLKSMHLLLCDLYFILTCCIQSSLTYACAVGITKCLNLTVDRPHWPFLVLFPPPAVAILFSSSHPNSQLSKSLSRMMSKFFLPWFSSAGPSVCGKYLAWVQLAGG